MAVTSTNPKVKAKPGRKPALVADDKTLSTVEGLAKIQCTQGEAAAVLGVSRETLHQFFKANLSAREKWDNGLEGGKASLRRNQFKLSETNAAMCIWLGKQYLGQRDVAVIQHTGDGGGPVKVAHALDLSKLDDRELDVLEQLIRKGGADAAAKTAESIAESPDGGRDRGGEG